MNTALRVLKVLGKLGLCYLGAGTLTMMYGTWFTAQPSHPHMPPWILAVFMLAPFAPTLISGVSEVIVYVASLLLFIWLAFRTPKRAGSSASEA